jgi:Zn-dependent M28 family amino/carboxypeptidase
MPEEKTETRRRLRFVSRGALLRLAVACGLLAGLAFGGYLMMVRMPGTSYTGELPPLSPREETLLANLRSHVEKLATDIGQRNVVAAGSLPEAAGYIRSAFAACGLSVTQQSYAVRNQECLNLAVEIPGRDRPREIVVVGGHYDTVPGCPGANDNATGAAAAIELARLFAGSRPSRTLRFVAFVNEEPPYFQTDLMGSRVYARGCRERGETITAMLCLETLGCYSDEKGSQSYPFPFSLFYPSTGNFIGFVGNLKYRSIVRRVIGCFRREARFPSQGGALPEFVPGVGWSDHWSFWQEGYPAVMVTDTAPFRYAHYHEASDTTDRIDFDRFARVVAGLEAVITDLANGS